MFAECGAWRNFSDLEDSLSLEELFCLYEGTMNRQTRLMRSAAAAWGGSGEDQAPEPSYSERLREERGEVKKSPKKHRPAWAIDPSVGGEATPVYGEEEVKSLPINLGYSIINE